MCQAALWLELVLCFQEEERPVLQRWMSVSLFFSFSFSIKKKRKTNTTMSVYSLPKGNSMTSSIAASTSSCYTGLSENHQEEEGQDQPVNANNS